MFHEIQKKLLTQAAKMAEDMRLFRVIPTEDLFEKYLSCFTDEVVRQEHNCNACKSFIRQYGKIIGIKDQKIHTLWDFELDGLYSEVPKMLGAIVRTSPIEGVFHTAEAMLGTPKSFALDKETGEVVTWEHFYWKTPNTCKVQCSKTATERSGTLNTNRAMFKRALDELTSDALQTVVDLSENNTLYRGKDYVKSVKELLLFKKQYDLLSERTKELLACEFLNHPCVRIRNTAIGTLLIDLSEGRDLEQSVKAYERVVAPANYKRPTALVTAKMVDMAKETVKSLGMEASLKRRYATAQDISINNVIFANRDTTVTELFDELKENIPVDVRKLKVSNKMDIETFINEIVPTAKSMDILFQDSHSSNMMTLVAPVDKDSPSLFDWDNGFSWSYSEGVADSIKEKVKQAGGKVDGELRISLEWYNHDDLDLHVTEPSGNIIYYGFKKSPKSGGNLDVDMNVGSLTRTPVENIIFPTSRTMENGTYKVIVHNYNRRESIDVGFSVEVECRGELLTFAQPTSPSGGSKVVVATLDYDKSKGIILKSGTPSKSATTSKMVYGIGTNKFHKVDMLTLSPNYWSDKGRGNKHYFFIIEGAKADNPPRPFFNEFLKGSLTEHRKVFEMLGGKVKVEDSDNQLNGLGFSETLDNECVVRVDGKLYKVTFGASKNV